MPKLSKLDSSVLHEIVCVVHKRMIPGVPIPEEAWETARQMVYALHQIDTEEWINANIGYGAFAKHIEWKARRLILGDE